MYIVYIYIYKYIIQLSKGYISTKLLRTGAVWFKAFLHSAIRLFQVYELKTRAVAFIFHGNKKCIYIYIYICQRGIGFRNITSSL